MMDITFHTSRLPAKICRRMSTAAMQRGAVTLALLLSTAPLLLGQTIEWTRQLGVGGDVGYAVSANGQGDVYLAGLTFGNLDGEHENYWDHLGDAFVTKTNSAGHYFGSRQFGLGGHYQDITYGVAADNLGNLYIAGSNEGGLAGSTDGFMDTLYADTGADHSTRKFVTDANETCTGVSADGLGNAYVSGRTDGNLAGTSAGGRDAFLSMSGSQIWTRQFGTSADDESLGVSADGIGNVYVAGWTSGDLDGANAGGRDAFLSKYNAAGSQLWSRQFGTSDDDESLAISADKLGNIFVAGYTVGSLEGVNAGGRDAFLSEYNAAGNLVWTHQLGTSADDQSSAVAADGLGNVYISGYTAGSLNGTNAGGRDAFVSKYAANGAFLWTRQFGTSANDESLGMSADGMGNIYLAGRTEGNLSVLGAPYEGSGGNAFLLKIVDVRIPGDYNGNGTVDAADYTVWRDTLGQIGPSLTADGNANHQIDAGDYQVWKENFGVGTRDMGTGNGSALHSADRLSPSVPEPACWMLVTLGLIGVVACSRPRQYWDGTLPRRVKAGAV